MKVETRLSLTFPDGIRANEADIAEWLNWSLGIFPEIHLLNPLADLELSDCDPEARFAEVDGRTIKL